MTSFQPSCTEPGRWDRAPDADAPASEVLAYLQHCDLCEYHAMLNLEDDLALDVLLRDACRDLDVHDVERPARKLERQPMAWLHRWRRPDRAPRARILTDRFRYEQRLTQASIAAFSIVVLWISFTAYQLNQAHVPEAPVADVEDVAPFAAAPLSGQLIADRKAGHLYISRVQPLGDRVVYEEDHLTAMAPRQVGSMLRVTNPQNGRVVQVKIVERSYEAREIFLSSQAADSLGLDEAAYVFVEVLHTPPPAGLAP